MTKEETVQILSLLKAAYPNAYKGMTKQEANGVISVWATQFISTPVEVVLIAVNKLIATNSFPPSISEVKNKMSDIYWECVGTLASDNLSNALTDGERSTIVRLMDECKNHGREPSVALLVGNQIKSQKEGLPEDVKAYDKQ